MLNNRLSEPKLLQLATRDSMCVDEYIIILFYIHSHTKIQSLKRDDFDNFLSFRSPKLIDMF